MLTILAAGLISFFVVGGLVSGLCEAGSRVLDTTTDWGIIDMPPRHVCIGRIPQRSPQEENELCRLKREARQRGEHIVG